MKKELSIEELCEKHPKEFAKYMNYCRSLKFEDKPCIIDLKLLFFGLLGKKEEGEVRQFDWIKKNIIKEIKFDEEGEGEDSEILI